jgi:hypothetical protein
MLPSLKESLKMIESRKLNRIENSTDPTPINGQS